MRNQFFKYRWSYFAILAGLTGASLNANAEATFQRSENQYINIGIASRISYSSIEDGAPNGKDRSNDFTVEEARLYTNGKVHENIGFEFNFARNQSDNKIDLLDGHLGLEFNNYVNIWLGRFLPPASRASASAPQYPPTFDFPIAEQAPNRFGGRDDGATVWGASADQAFKYQFGAFKGRDGLSNDSDNLSYATRLQYNFWDPEPGFYNLASYDGAKSILSVGGSYRFQADGAGTALNKGDYQYWNLDGRLEKALAGGGVLGAEASYYDYDNDNTLDAFAPQGKGFFVLGSYTLPQTFGIGKIQPKASYQKFDNETSNITTSRYDIGAGYLINGSSNTRIDTFYFKESRNQGLPDVNGVKVIFHVAHFF
jgi:hypothetical protein